jgi:acetoin:2,6-dichlorophenolindophenol oxidoreductase subunit alpha
MLAPLVAEMLGRSSGVCGGRAGSMNVVDLEHGLIGCYGIVGGSIAAALGAAMSGKRQGRVAVASSAMARSIRRTSTSA